MNSESEDFTSLNLGKFAAPYIAYFISEVNIIGINPGSSVDKTVKQLKNKKILYNKDRKVVQIMGGYNSSFYSSYSQPNEIAKELGNVLSCESYYLNCPAVVEQKTLREQLVKENSISKVIKFWKQIDLAIMGLGVADKRSKLFNLFNEESKKKIEKVMLVG